MLASTKFYAIGAHEAAGAVESESITFIQPAPVPSPHPRGEHAS